MATSINTAEIPVSIVASATAASYTVPSDRYAIVKAQVKAGGTLSISGVVVLGSDTWSVIIANANVIRLNQGLASYGGMMNVPLYNNAGNSAAGPTAIGSTSFGVSNSSNGGDVFANTTARTSDTAQFKVPAGTTIVGSGDSRYMIELYRIPGSAT